VPAKTLASLDGWAP